MLQKHTTPYKYTLPDWPENLKDKYQKEKWWTSETFGSQFETSCGKYPHNIAVIYKKERRTYSQLLKRSRQLAHFFIERGLNKGDIVIVQLPNSLAFVEVALGLFFAGVVPIFSLPTHRERELTAFAEATNARAYICQESIDGFSLKTLAESLQQQLPDLRPIFLHELPGEEQPTTHAPLPAILPEDLVCFQLSGGTTGIPKLIARRHRDYLCNIRASIEACEFDATTVYLAVLPLGHNFPLACPGALGTLFAGGRVVLSDKNYPDSCFDLMAEENVTVTALVPPLAMVWLDAAEIMQPHLPNFKVLQVGGAKMSYEAAKRVKPILGCTLQQVYGMAEGLICFTQLDDSDALILHTQGKPMTQADEIRVVDKQGSDVAPGEIGYLLTRGPYTITGYYGPSEINANAFTAEGFYCSGDLVRATPEGYLIAEGRDKDQINRGGEKIDCGEVEDILLRHPLVLDAAVVGINDDYLGECICAFILSKSSDLNAVELRQFLQQQGVATFKIPDRFNFPATFNTTAIGKISKKNLRAELKADYLSALLPDNSRGKYVF